jgi:hypothetical protein
VTQLPGASETPLKITRPRRGSQPRKAASETPQSRLEITAARRAFSQSAPVTQRHIFKQHHREADLRSSTGRARLLEADGSLVEVLVEAASNGGTGTSCWSWCTICGVSG